MRNGQRVRFWEDGGVVSSLFVLLSPFLFALATAKDVCYS